MRWISKRSGGPFAHRTSGCRCGGCAPRRQVSKAPGSQVLGQGSEAFPTKDNTDMLPPRLLLAAADPDEVTKQVCKRLARDHHARFFGMGEVWPAFEKRGHVSRLRRLTEDDVALRTVQRPPLPHPPLQSAPDAIIRECQRVQTLKMAQQGDGQKGAVARKQRKQVAIPVSFKRVRDGAPMRNLAVGWQRRIGIETRNRNGGPCVR